MISGHCSYSEPGCELQPDVRWVAYYSTFHYSHEKWDSNTNEKKIKTWPDYTRQLVQSQT